MTERQLKAFIPSNSVLTASVVSHGNLNNQSANFPGIDIVNQNSSDESQPFDMIIEKDHESSRHN